MNQAEFKAALADPKARRKLLRAAAKTQHTGPEDGYTVTYVIDVDDAETPREAALKVEEWLRDGEGFRPTFDVRDNKTGETTTIDLEDQPC